MFHVPNQYRIKDHPLLATTDKDGNNGAFCFASRIPDRTLWVIASDSSEEPNLPQWEHVSVHVVRNGSAMKIPLWEEMCYVKELFWDDEDVVIQYHPKKSEYVNNHKYTLHLWRPIGIELPTPPMIYVGVK